MLISEILLQVEQKGRSTWTLGFCCFVSHEVPGWMVPDTEVSRMSGPTKTTPRSVRWEHLFKMCAFIYEHIQNLAELLKWILKVQSQIMALFWKLIYCCVLYSYDEHCMIPK